MNLLLLLVDSLRADHLSGYGYKRRTSPFLDSLARNSAWFDQCFTPAIPTLPAYTSMFSGQFPVAHRVLTRKGDTDLPAGTPWVPQILARHGYATAAVDTLAARKQWCAGGFQHYFNLRSRNDEYLDCFQFNRAAMPWLEAHRDEKFFLYIRYCDPHTPYWPPPQYRRLFYDGDPTATNHGSLDEFYRGPLLNAGPLKRYLIDQWLAPAAAEWPGASGTRIEDIEWCRAQYDAEVRVVDDGIAQLLGRLEKLGLAENTGVILLGDHGEPLGEHGIYFDHHGLYDCTLHIPLIIHWPGVIGTERRIKALTQLPDIAPTVLEMLGVPAPDTMAGRSLVPLLTGQTDKHVYSKIVASECTWMFKWALRKDQYKLILARQPDIYGRPPVELYDLFADPEEQINLADDRPKVRDELVREFEAWLSRRLTETGQVADPVALQGLIRYKHIRRSLMRMRLKHAMRSWFSAKRDVTNQTSLPRPWPVP
jgi:arylsulfatase A-like enzyme